MIAYLKGEILEVKEDGAIILCGGVGYEVNLAHGSALELTAGQETAFYVAESISPYDGTVLYGFLTKEDKELWKSNFEGMVGAIEDLSQQLDKLKVELEQEKALKETYLTCYKAKHEDIEGALFKLKQTLTEIKAICNNNDELQGDFNVVDCDKYKLGKHNLANKILQKIKEYKVEE